MNHLSCWQFIQKRLSAGQRIMLLTVAASAGSSPGRPGFKMAVDETGALQGSIGGGIMEVKLVELAREKLQKGDTKPFCKRQIHRPDAPRDRSGMICSGEQTVVFTPLTKEDLPAVRRLIGCLKKQIPAVLCLYDAGFHLLEDRTNETPYQFEARAGAGFIFEENTGFQNHLCIIGGGHCALALSELMSKLDFHISLFDDRPGLDTVKKNRFAHKIQIIDNYANIGGLIPHGENVYLVVMTLGYRSDEQVIRQLAGKQFKYFGVLGSAAKMQTVLENLRRDGIPEEYLRRIHTPAGLHINSRTPEEIAVSIAAEIIAVKNG
ncbi:MAG: XdhC family protein [Thermoanaerobaculia bacterium]|nr:XdhC family protein [Thermoanaerobaculia bacterium]